MSTSLSRSSTICEEVQRVHLVEAPCLPKLVVGGAQEVRVGDARDLDRILEREEEALLGALFRSHGEQILAVVRRGARRDVVARVACQHLRQRALARAVGSHDGVDLALVNAERDAMENLVLADAGVEVVDTKSKRLGIRG